MGEYPEQTQSDDAVQTGGRDPGANGRPDDVYSNTSEQERAFVKSWIERINAAKKHWKTVYDQMNEDMILAARGAPKSWLDNKNNYVVPVLNRLVSVNVAQLYARNPTAVATRRERMMYEVWDGTLATLQQAEQMIQQSMEMGIPPDPNMQAIVQDAEAVKQYDIMMDGVGKTLTILYKHYIEDPTEAFKQEMKSLVRRTKTVGVGWCRLNFQRIMEKNPDITTKIDETAQQIATVQRLQHEQADGDLQDGSPDLEELQQTMAALQEDETIIVKEGPFWSWPSPKKVIVDPATKHLKTLLGCNWLAEEMDLTPDEIYENWKVDVATSYTQYKAKEGVDWTRWSETDQKLSKSSTARVYRVQNRKMGVEFVVVEGYPAYVQQPAKPKIRLPRFYDLFPLVFNEVEDDENPYPPSDVWNGRHLQAEYNRTREFLREHRQQNRPAYVTAKGSFEEEDLEKLGSHKSGEIIELAGMATGDKIADKLQAKPVMQIDPRQYEVEGIFTDLQRVIGVQQANVGPTAGSTATESSIAENSRETESSDQQDDLDDFLTLLAQSTAIVMLRELSADTVTEIVGPGAKWPTMQQTREEIAEEISLETRAGSSGRPNQAAELAKLERGMPQLLQLPGVNPIPLAQRYVDVLDLDLEDTIIEGLPSIAAVNQMAAKVAQQGGPGGPGAAPGAGPNAPGMQGPQGANNAPQPPGTQNQGQPAYPATVHFHQHGSPHPPGP